MSIKHILVSIALTFALMNCSSYDFSRRVVQQGNLLQQATLERLKLGMSKENVAVLMGTSLLSPMFDNDRWDYAFTWRRGTGPLKIRNLTLYFKHGKLVRIEHYP